MKYYLSILLLFAASFSNAQRKRINFDDNWTFALGHANDPLKDFKFSMVNIFAKSGVVAILFSLSKPEYT